LALGRLAAAVPGVAAMAVVRERLVEEALAAVLVRASSRNPRHRWQTPQQA
jgi:hypothetical protein